MRLRPDVLVKITSPLAPPPIFPIMQKLGKMTHREMYQTFNMGMGFSAVLPPMFADTAIEILARHGLKSAVVGKIARGRGVMLPNYKLKYTKY
jgi:phosphoribosylformylglycinamidine cyclo-ligase